MKKATQQDIEKRNTLLANIRKLDMGDYREISPIVKKQFKVTGYQFDTYKGHVFLKINNEFVPVDKSGSTYLGVDIKELFSELTQDIFSKIEYANSQFSLLAGLESNIEF